jgi:hypothetical protein
VTHAVHRIDEDSVRVASELVPVTPSIKQVAAAAELVDRRRREPCLDVQGVAWLAQAEPSRQPTRCLERLLDVEGRGRSG